MKTLQIFLVILFILMAGYTAVTIVNHGWTLVPIFFGDLMSFTWPGQFNLDFMSYLSLSALWIAWRHRFSGMGIGLALIALVAGMLFFSLYLLWASLTAKGDIKQLLLGSA